MTETGTDRPGLTEAEARARRAAGQGNDYRPPTSRTYLEILGQNAYPAINGVLGLVAILLALAGLVVEALLTAGPVIVNVAVGVVQEARAKQQLDRIALLHRPRATVRREGIEREVDPAEIVVGDLVVARRGDQIVVDGEIVGDGQVELDESLLTGESDPVARQPGDRVFSGTAVVSGTVLYEARTVGAATMANRLLDEARRMKDRQTPLQREIAATIWAIAGLVVAVAGLVALAPLPGVSDSRATLEAAAVLVTLVPQGLAIMITVTYAVGALRVTRLGALVQRRNAVESMSRVDTLCLDKTGTLTTQRISFAGVEPFAGSFTEPTAEGTAEPAAEPFAEPVATKPDRLRALLGALAAASRSRNRTMEALAAAFPAPPVPIEDEVPFSSERRWSALRFGAAPGSRSAAGAPVETGPAAAGAAGAPVVAASAIPPVEAGTVLVLGALAALRPALAGPIDELAARAAALAGEGLRVLLLARARTGARLRDDTGRPALPAPLVPLALLSFVEELRPDVHETLQGFARAGVELKVISGDDPATVEAIGRRVGLAAAGPAVSGLDLAGLDDREIAAVAARANLFGRVEPALKARLVAALSAAGRYVAMIGDGVNDLLPLRRANLGIAMESGSPATRGAADLVLLGDSFAVLPRAVVEGQRILAAMEATLVILLARTFYVLLIIAGAAAAGLPFPLTPRQNSVLAFVTVGIPLIVLTFLVHPHRAPRHLVGETLRISIPAAVAVTALALPVFAGAVDAGLEVDEARSVLTTITVLCGLGLLPLIRSSGPPGEAGRAEAPETTAPGGALERSWPWLLAGLMLAVYLGLLAIPPARDFYELAPLPAPVLVVLLVAGAAWTGAVHVVRAALLARRRKAGRAIGRAISRGGRGSGA